MSFFELYGIALLTVLAMVSVLWVISVIVKDASIIDMFWGPLFVAIVWVLLPAGRATYSKDLPGQPADHTLGSAAGLPSRIQEPWSRRGQTLSALAISRGAELVAADVPPNLSVPGGHRAGGCLPDNRRVREAGHI